MMDDKKTNIENTEVKGYRELKSYEDYKQNGNDGTRHIVEPNSFKQKVLILINESKKQDKYLHDNHILDRMNLHHDKNHNIL